MLEVVPEAALIAGFVFVMMLVIEYLNVLTRGRWDRVIERWTWGQWLFGSGMGATPGCLGAYAVASLYMHRIVTYGALMATMMATCGDEAYVMLALFPGRAVFLFLALFILGVAVGLATDRVLRFRKTALNPHLAEYHASHDGVAECIPFSRGQIAAQWRRCTPHRGWLGLLLVLFIAGVLTGKIGHRHLGLDPVGPAAAHAAHEEHAEDAASAAGHHHGHEGWDWVRATLLAAGLLGLLVVVTVPDHFLDEHLWNHLVRVHLWRILLWTLGALVVTHLLLRHMDVATAVAAHRLPLLLLACLVGIIPESGPHIIFVTLYAQGGIPFSVLLANSIVQDGHGMIPILAHSWADFVSIKAVKLVIGLALGLAGYWMGW